MPRWTVLEVLPGLPLYLEAESGALTRSCFARPAGWLNEERDDAEATLAQAALELREYASGRRRRFEVAFELSGTHFQCEVWAALFEIPFGETRSYSDIAQSIGRPTATRAVGLANNANPLAVIVPCHRVIGARGALTGYAAGLDVKRRLLVHEGVLLA